MSGFALSLILAAAFVHATWNYLLKRSGGGTAFVWLFAAISAAIYAPLGALLIGCGAVLLMTPIALKSSEEIKPTWRRAKKEIIAVALLCPLSYILVLSAMVFTPVSYVAPAREVSILIAALMGAHLLREGDVPRRLTAAAAMVAGITCLALG